MLFRIFVVVDKKQLILIFSLAAFALMLVMTTQVVWAINAYSLNKKEIRTSVKTALAVTAKKTTGHSACFEMFSKAYIKPGESFYLPVLKKDKVDTVPMLFSGRGIFYKESEKKILKKYKRINFSWPITAEIVINFRYQANDSTFLKISQDTVFNKLSPLNYQEVFAGNIDVTDLYDIKYMDSTLHVELLKQFIDMPYTVGIIESGSNKVVYKSDTAAADKALLNSEYINDLNEDGYFNKHYQMALIFNAGFIVGKKLWVMLLAGAFVVLLLITLMWQFIRVINRQRKINEMKNDFINNMTHEFNTPIANISLAAESLTRSEELQKDEKTARLVSIIREQNENIRGNVEHILKIAANDKQVMQLNKEKLNVADLIKSVAYEFNLSLNEKKGLIDFTEPAAPVFINADELYILHVLQNIIDNAIKYNYNRPMINITVGTHESFVVIDICDNGIGMGKEEVKYIFDKFYRVSTGNIHHAKGFGLGLNYVQSIIKAHEGYVKVKSTPGKGSCFELYIPKI